MWSMSNGFFLQSRGAVPDALALQAKRCNRVPVRSHLPPEQPHPKLALCQPHDRRRRQRDIDGIAIGSAAVNQEVRLIG